MSAPMPHPRVGGNNMDQHPPHVPQSPQGMPRVIQRQYEEQYSPQVRETEARPLAEVLYELLWPVGSWCLILVQVAILISVMLKMISAYNGFDHAQVTAVSVLAFGALAAIHKYWVVIKPQPEETKLPQ